MAVITNKGREIIAESVATGGLHLAWGTGGSWTSPPTENVSATSLVAELGRRIPEEISFVVPDNAGTIILQAGRFTRSITPTRWLYIYTQFDFADEPTATIREVALFKGSTFTGAAPGQKYFPVSQLASAGKMLHLRNLAPIIRSNLNLEQFHDVIEF